MNRPANDTPAFRDKKFRPQLHIFLLLLVWSLVVGTACLYTYFVSQSYWRPSRYWWLLTTGSIVFASMAAAWLVVRRFWHGSQRTWSIAIFMFTVWPIVLFLCFVWLVVATANARGDLALSWPVRTFGFWVSNYFEWESEVRYSRITKGEFVELHDRGTTPNVEQMVEDMDVHIQEMAELLGQQPPETTTAWVRGKLFGQGGRAVGAWALCANPKEIGELQILDRHEVAHTTITLLSSGYQDPPMLLAEGWAQSQSNDFKDLVLSLQRLKRSGMSFSINELVSDDYYGRSIGPNYSHGGPLAGYLLTRFGGPKFFELYSQVRRSTFLEDAERILGVPWAEIDADFWQWLDEQRIDVFNRPAVVFANDQVRDKWKQIADEAIAYEKEHSVALPTNVSYQMSFDKGSYLVALVKRGDEVWMTSEYPKKQNLSSTFARQSPKQGDFYLEQFKETGLIEGDLKLPKGDTTIRYFIKNAWERTQKSSLRNQYIFDILVPQDYENVEVEIFIKSIESGEKPGDPWTVQLVESWEEDGVTSESQDRLSLDPDQGFRVIELLATYPDQETHRRAFQYGSLGDSPITTQRSTTIKSANGKTVTTSTTDIIELTPTEADSIVRRVELALEQRKAMVKFDWSAFFINPYSVALGWLLLAIVVSLIDFIGNRMKIAVPVSPPTTESSP